jgi:hypothetical protein
MPETKPKQSDALRIPKPKKKLGLAVPPSLRLPHEDLISPISEPQQEKPNQTLPSHTRRTSQTSLTSTSSHTSERPSIAPQRDYMKVANSIGREAVPAGLFTGKSKQLYDCLYSMTRGAIVPTRTTRISRPKLMEKAHIGSRVTFDANVERLIRVGLITVLKIVGEHEGNEYTVNLPEEIDFTIPSQTSQASQTSQTSPAQNLDILVRPETSQTSQSSFPIKSIVSEDSKTSFKTNINYDDDEAFAKFVQTFQDAAKEITGKPLSTYEKERLGELAELLVTELRIAAARTTNVSSIPAFLTEHLRRRLWKKDKQQLSDEGKADAREIMAINQTLEINKCPDCGGSGMYYPEGYEKGVARCKHERLQPEGNSAPAT